MTEIRETERNRVERDKKQQRQADRDMQVRGDSTTIKKRNTRSAERAEREKQIKSVEHVFETETEKGQEGWKKQRDGEGDMGRGGRAK